MNRRTRAAAKASSKSTITTNGKSLVANVTAKAAVTVSSIDFASPKRKDCKLDMNSSPMNQNMLVNGHSGKRTTAKGIAKMKKPHQSPITSFFHKDRANGMSASELDNHNVSVNESDSSIQNEHLCDKTSLPANALKQNGVRVNAIKKIDNVDAIDGIDVVDKSDSVTLRNGSTDGINSFLLTSPPPKLRNINAAKQTTPHRIVAPSSPSKKQRIYAVPSFSDLNIDDDISSGKHSRKTAAKKSQKKSKRRLHVNGTENLQLKVNVEETVDEVITISDDSSDIVFTNAVSNDSEEDVNKNIASTKLNKKIVLNSSVDPTAQQNTTNNNKLPVGPISTTQQSNAMPRSHATQMTDYFPIRRSVRKTKKAVEEEQLRYIEIAIEKQQEDGLVVKDFGEKGRGIVAGRPFCRGEFVVEYIGELIDQSEADRREEEYAKNSDFGCYMYYFKHKEQQWCLDATEETGKLGRLVNHSRNGNLMTRIVNYRQAPHLVLLAKDDIKEGEELTYDYGDRRREALLHHPWLAF